MELGALLALVALGGAGWVYYDQRKRNKRQQGRLDRLVRQLIDKKVIDAEVPAPVE